MFEIFFFVNPIGVNCYQNEQEIIAAVSGYNQNISYHFIPITTMNTIRNDIKARHLSLNNVEVFNTFSQSAYNATKDYHTLKLIVGNKKARQYIINLQHAINDMNRTYSPELVDEILNSLDVSIKNFKKNRESNYIKLSMDKDLKLADDLNVVTTPTTIIFNYDDDQGDSGMMIEGCANREEIESAIVGDK
ncbi:DsbA family protein [Lactobacillus johnsonii]|nr:DsbA family protein [Lactobacillus johnsonii]UOC05811.1 DsbA family protein [Lactobacillus johnsonii]